MSDQDIEEAIKQAAQKAGYDLSQSTIEKIKDMVKNLQGLDIDWGGLKDKLQGIDAGGWFQRLVNWVKGFFE